MLYRASQSFPWPPAQIQEGQIVNTTPEQAAGFVAQGLLVLEPDQPAPDQPAPEAPAESVS